MSGWRAATTAAAPESLAVAPVAPVVPVVPVVPVAPVVPVVPVAPEPGRPVIRLVGLCRTYPGPPAVTALRDVDLVVRRGDYLAIVGPSGSGKSTLLNLLGLLDRPTAGAYELDGTDVATLAERDRAALRGRRIGFVFQSFHLLPYRTAVENVVLAQVYNRTPRSSRSAAAIAALEQVGLAHRLYAQPSTMSGGERQRVAIARALVNEPAILLCDEPTGNLDSCTSDQLLSLLDGLHAAGLTLVVITHAPDVAARAQRVVSIRDGELTEVPPGGAGTPRAARPRAARQEGRAHDPLRVPAYPA